MGRRAFDPETILASVMRGEHACGDLPMRIDRTGQWHYQGSPIGRIELCKLFARILHRAPDGSFWLITPVEQGRIAVDDAPFTAVEVQRTGTGSEQRLVFRTNLDEWVPLDTDHPLRMADGPAGPLPYIRVRGGLEARLLPSVFYELAELAEPDPHTRERVGVWSAGSFFALGELDEE